MARQRNKTSLGRAAIARAMKTSRPDRGNLYDPSRRYREHQYQGWLRAVHLLAYELNLDPGSRQRGRFMQACDVADPGKEA